MSFFLFSSLDMFFSTSMKIKQASRCSVLACKTGMKYLVLVLLHVALSSKAYKNQIWKLLFCETLRFPGYHSASFSARGVTEGDRGATASLLQIGMFILLMGY